MHGWFFSWTFAAQREDLSRFYILSPLPPTFSFSTFKTWTTNADVRSNVEAERRNFRWISLNRSPLSIIVRTDA